jgi:ribosome-associated protein
MRAKKLQKAIVAALEDIKARDIEVIDVSKLTAMFDFVVIATAESGRQARALAMHVHDVIKQADGKVYGMEGEQTDWVLVDAGDTVVHIMLPAAREHYNLEQLWQPKRAPKRDGAVSARKRKDGAVLPRQSRDGAAPERESSTKPRGAARTRKARAGAREKAVGVGRKPARKPAARKRAAASD